MKSEREHDKAKYSAEQIKYLDLNTLSAVGAAIDAEDDMRFIVTGSYAIEALTEVSSDHGDMDANVFCLDTKAQLARVASLMDDLSVSNAKVTLFKEREDRLAYDIQTDQSKPRRLEIQFVEVTEIDDSKDSFQLRDGGIVPTTRLPIKNSHGEELNCRVKSLPYVIATWVIRTSGLAEKAKRPVRESDFTHLMQLLAKNYSDEEVIQSMAQHPQMPAEMSEIIVFNELMKKLK